MMGGGGCQWAHHPRGKQEQKRSPLPTDTHFVDCRRRRRSKTKTKAAQHISASNEAETATPTRASSRSTELRAGSDDAWARAVTVGTPTATVAFCPYVSGLADTQCCKESVKPGDDTPAARAEALTAAVAATWTTIHTLLGTDAKAARGPVNGATAAGEAVAESACAARAATTGSTKEELDEPPQ